jgi:hypothetical protein
MFAFNFTDDGPAVEEEQNMETSTHREPFSELKYAPAQSPPSLFCVPLSSGAALMLAGMSDNVRTFLYVSRFITIVGC